MSEFPNGAQPQHESAPPPAMERAEELVDLAGQRLGHWTAIVSQRLQKFAALAREEGEDIWAEAQSIRQGAGRMSTQDVSADREQDEAQAEPS